MRSWQHRGTGQTGHYWLGPESTSNDNRSRAFRAHNRVRDTIGELIDLETYCLHGIHHVAPLFAASKRAKVLQHAFNRRFRIATEMASEEVKTM